MPATSTATEPLWPGAPVMAQLLHAPTTTLAPNEIFVFGSNRDGFHGAGGAGLACRGDAANTWRRDDWFKRAMVAPPGDPARVGRWAVFGVARGFQVGRSGRSYAVQTIERPGRTAAPAAGRSTGSSWSSWRSHARGPRTRSS